MLEFRIPLQAHIALPQDPEALFGLAVGILGDAGAALAQRFAAITLPGLDSDDELDDTEPFAEGLGWDPGDRTIRDAASEAIVFAATFFDACLIHS